VYASRLSDFLVLLKPRVAAGLVDAFSLERIERIARTIPAAAFDHIGFERRLDLADAGADFAFSLSAYGLDWIESASPWPEVARFAEDWGVDRTPGLWNVWLSFDTSSGEYSARPPNVYLDLDRSNAEALRIPRSFSVAEHFTRCLEALPPTVTRIQLGFMLARDTEGLRFCARPLSLSDALNLLEALEWPGDRASVAAIMEAYEPLCDTFCLQVDVGSRTRQRLGFELRYRGTPWAYQPPREDRWFALFERLGAGGLCTDAQRAALVDWCASLEFEAPLIERLIAAANPSADRLIAGTLYTGLHYLKLTIDSNRLISAKAYFGAILDASAPEIVPPVSHHSSTRRAC
jgi:hypothetical protein